ncbi:Asp/Glu/Hydantoin racemase family protein [Roseobacter sp. SK209-2-6]|uniref:aspartate/glutamate racemase family protein n=1 Tax=Roseobacter sp. SK209-2-6 TaxID=388739 RepID=UPI0000F3D818|nr:aspartate/glutamate racemase family protein [Roseobacter sp. SK209-2-6]EBA17250.1 Asp/Glu/Hydantoin racemase family protein [Roseobacter sp. SK209-2-6]
MKKIGILGGVGWASTLDYYRGICAGAWSHQREAGTAPKSGPIPVPRITIESVNQAETRSLRGMQDDEQSWADFDAVFHEALLTLEVAGCDFAVIASNTPHARLHSITRGVAMPVLSIYEATASAVLLAGAKKALVIGTSVTLQSPNYSQVMTEHSIRTLGPLPEEEIAEAQAMIDEDFHGGASENARERLLQFCHRNAEPGTAVILACTELPLAFPDQIDDPIFEAEGFLFINTSAAHITAALERAMG